MLRVLVCALFSLALAFTAVMADDTRGKVRSVDAEKKTITISVDDKDKTFDVPADARISACLPRATSTAGISARASSAPTVPPIAPAPMITYRWSSRETIVSSTAVPSPACHWL